MLSYTALLGLLPFAAATKHQLFTGGFGGAHVYSLQFDDEALTLKLLQNITTNSGHSWIALSHDKANLYGVEEGSWASYTVTNGSGLTYDTFIGIGGNCSSDKGIFVVAAKKEPYNVYADPFGDCANVLGVDSSGTLSVNLQNISYSSGSGVHGLAIDPAGEYIYSADDTGNAIWTHKINNSTGTLTFLNVIDAPTTGANPRHVAIHPNGKYLYVILEESNEVAQYSINRSTHIPSFDNVTYSLLNDGSDSSNFWSDEVAVTPDGTTLWATARSRETTSNGTISAYNLTSTGAIDSRIFLSNTSTTGGAANAVTVSDSTSKYVALAESAVGSVQIWTIEDGRGKVVAEISLDDGGCCANAAWAS